LKIAVRMSRNWAMPISQPLEYLGWCDASWNSKENAIVPIYV
jgi:hypothetical protein